MAKDFNNALEVLQEARKRDVVLFIHNGSLKFRTADRQAVDDDFISMLKKYKDDIRELLNGYHHNDSIDWLQLREERQQLPALPLSFSQERLWFIHQLEGSVHYHIPWINRLRGPLNTTALTAAFRALIKRHEILRTVLYEEQGTGYQKIIDADGWQLQHTIVGAGNAAKESSREMISGLLDQPFDLSRDYMIRAHLLELDANEHILVVIIHHIAADGWSWNILLQELSALYSHFDKGKAVELPPLPLQYADFALWQRRFLQGTVLEQKFDYWKQKLAGVATLELPLDQARPPLQSTRGAHTSLVLDATIEKGLNELAQASGTTLFMVLLAAFKVLLHRYSGQDDICVGTPIAGRLHSETEAMVGFFVNTLALRTQLNGNSTFRQLLLDVKQTTLEAYEHQELPFEKIVEAVAAERDLSRTPVFQALFSLQYTQPGGDARFGDATLLGEGSYRNRVKFDLTLTVIKTGPELSCQFDYCADLFTEHTIHCMMDHYVQLLRAIIQFPGERIGYLPLLTAKEQEQLQQFGNSRVAYPREKSIISLFEEQANRTPDAIALVCGNSRISFRTLQERSHSLAKYLLRKGIAKESPVPIAVERNIDMIIGILGILKAGGAFVPIHPQYPEDQVLFMLEDLQPVFLLVTEQLRQKVQSFNGQLELIEISKECEEIVAAADGCALPEVSPNALAYIIYTSGSTGKPKGVMVEHRALTDHVSGIIEAAELAACRSFALIASLVADAQYSILFSSLLLGRELHIIGEELLLDGQGMIEYLKSHQIDCIKIVPSLWLSYAEQDQLVLPASCLIFGGETLPPAVAELLSAAQYPGRVYNHYGPTEAAIGKLIYAVSLHQSYRLVPVGKPFSNTEILIVDNNGQLCAIGVPGEILIGGEGLARGYWRRPALTEEKFIPNPFRKGTTMKVYRTGDRGRWLPHGVVEYLGRLDDQVKIRGHRIEPGAITAIAEESGLVKQCVVLANENKQGHTHLTGYVVPEPHYQLEALLSWLGSRLPDYMVPAQWIALPALPLTRIGKIDKRALAAMDTIPASVTVIVSPRNHREQILAAIWQELLGLEAVSVHHNFFELGGHSLLVFPLISRLRKLGCQLNFKDIFQYQTIEKLAGVLSVNEEKKVKTTGSTTIVWNADSGGESLFLLPGSPGFCEGYDELAVAFKNTWKIYGLQLPGLSDDQEPPQTLEQMATLLKEQLTAIQPTGPYRFIAHSFGAWPAYEIARQLELSGQTVEFMVLLDAPVLKKPISFSVTPDSYTTIDIIRNYLSSYASDFPFREEWIKEWSLQAGNLSPADLIPYLMGQLQSKWQDHNHTMPILRSLQCLLWQSSMPFHPTGRLNAQLLVAKAAATNWQTFDEFLGWRNHASRITAFTSAGSHFSMIRGKAAQQLAAQILEQIKL